LAACTLHGSEIDIDPTRTLDQDLREVRDGIAMMQRFAPEMGARLTEWLDALRDQAGTVPSQAMTLTHGDFTPGQVLLDPDGPGLVDLDTLCRSEPARDLGRFCAYLRVAVHKTQRVEGVALPLLADDLCDRFLRVYGARSAFASDETQHLHQRILLYELASLLLLALHSWQEFKANRTKDVLSVLEERITERVVHR
jgi:aminoglycoside phosphotransferase (APT) family kinase protein